jgi:hypothetical protein
MQTKKSLTFLIVGPIAFFLMSSSAVADSKQRHRWEGVAIGLGAAILGHTIYLAHQNAPQPQAIAVAPPHHRHRPHLRKHRHGHWEWRKTWVPPSFEKVWNPGHYNRKGRWVPGRWVELKTSEGHWHRERIWVAGNHRPGRCYYD